MLQKKEQPRAPKTEERMVLAVIKERIMLMMPAKRNTGQQRSEKIIFAFDDDGMENPD